MWVAAGSPSTFEKAARMGLGVLCFTTGPAAQLAPLIETYKREIVNAEPVGDYVNDNVMVTSGMLCLEDGQRARDALLATDDNRHKSLLFRYLDTFPRPPGIPSWPELAPKMSADELEAAIQLGEYCIGDPGRGRPRGADLRRHRRGPTHVRHAVVQPADRARARSDRDVRPRGAAPLRSRSGPPHDPPARSERRRPNMRDQPRSLKLQTA